MFDLFICYPGVRLMVIPVGVPLPEAGFPERLTVIYQT